MQSRAGSVIGSQRTEPQGRGQGRGVAEERRSEPGGDIQSAGITEGQGRDGEENLEAKGCEPSASSAFGREHAKGICHGPHR